MKLILLIFLAFSATSCRTISYQQLAPLSNRPPVKLVESQLHGIVILLECRADTNPADKKAPLCRALGRSLEAQGATVYFPENAADKPAEIGKNPPAQTFTLRIVERALVKTDTELNTFFFIVTGTFYPKTTLEYYTLEASLFNQNQDIVAHDVIEGAFKIDTGVGPYLAHKVSSWFTPRKGDEEPRADAKTLASRDVYSRLTAMIFKAPQSEIAKGEP